MNKMKTIKFSSIDNSDIEQKADHIWSLMKAAQKAGVKTYVAFGNYKSN